MKHQQKQGAGLHDLIGGKHSDLKPRHPDAQRWTIALCGLVVVLIAWWGPAVVAFASRLHPRIDQFTSAQIRWFDLLFNAARYGAWTWVGLTVLGLSYALARAIVWRRYQIPRIRGSYWAVVLPKPQGGRAGTTTPIQNHRMCSGIGCCTGATTGHGRGPPTSRWNCGAILADACSGASGCPTTLPRSANHSPPDHCRPSPGRLVAMPDPWEAALAHDVETRAMMACAGIAVPC